jgi:hypothetical protein
MAATRVILLDLDRTVAVQPSLAALRSAGHALRLDATDLAPRLRIVASRGAARSLAARLAPVFAGEAPLIFFGSGDFHHLTAVFLSLLRERVTVLHFDNHPDWIRFPPTLNCGGWVSRALALPQVERVVTIGPASDDLRHPELKGADLPAIRAGRHEVHPWRGAEHGFWGRRVAASACRSKGWKLRWDGLERRSWETFADELAARLPAAPLWITLDKDVLPPEEAATNWDHGAMPLDAVLGIVERLARERRLLGADVCGDVSPPRFADPFRWLLSATDRSTRPPATPDELALNDRTNRRIADALGGHFA